ncbi:hypothetical protein CDAR_442741 [Caerostris darwini]|uniref:Uncharacterized protein n=1 Tax=Caerostris darwini TaxID=1538125 RepID=A0AAV4VNM9_9ARAC|nr:hypothetical protein CDAR_442741 [Caerostris darwini]
MKCPPLSLVWKREELLGFTGPENEWEGGCFPFSRALPLAYREPSSRINYCVLLNCDHPSSKQGIRQGQMRNTFGTKADFFKICLQLLAMPANRPKVCSVCHESVWRTLCYNFRGLIESMKPRIPPNDVEWSFDDSTAPRNIFLPNR